MKEITWIAHILWLKYQKEGTYPQTQEDQQL